MKILPSLLVLTILANAGTSFADTASLVVLKNGTLVDGYEAYGTLAAGKNGALYGSFARGGAGSAGTLFRMNANGGSFTVVHDFLNATGGTPVGGPIIARDGRLYGTTYNGGSTNDGAIYRFDPATSAYTDLHDMTSATDGRNSLSRLVESADGKLYGTAYSGGANNAGTIFRLNKDGSGFIVLRVLATGADGGSPAGTPIFGRDGRLYGTCTIGGANNGGTLYAIRTDGTGFTVLRALTPGMDGSLPFGALVEGTDGFLYGVASSGGAGGGGTVFKIRRNGTDFQVLKAFGAPAADGANPNEGLTFGSDGKLYGTTLNGGAKNYGTLFSIQTNGVFRKLADFDRSATGTVSEYGSLTQIAPLVFVGAAYAGGANNIGTIFKFTAAVADPRVTPKKKRLTTTEAKAKITGIASGAAGIAKVKYQIGSGPAKTAKGTTKWSFTAALQPGKNTITVTAYDTRGNASKPVKIRVTRKEPLGSGSV